MQGYVTQAEYDELKAKYESQKFRLEQLERMLFGAKSERFMPEQLAGQLSLFGSPLAEQEGQTTKEVIVEGHTRQGWAKGQAKRLALPEHLERRQTILEPDVDTSGMEKIGEEVSEILEYEPAKLVVHRIIRPKYVLKEGKNAPEGCKVHIAALPMRPIERCMAAATLLAIICIEKYIDHLPLYRQRMRYRRLGMDFPSSTICGWVAQVAALLEILYDKLVDLVLQSQYLQIDETTMRVLQRRRPKNRGSTLNPKKGKTHLGYYWAFYDVNNGLLFFRYHKTREQTVPYSALKDFQGAVQVDGYSAYEGLDLIYQIVLVNCWAHARRKFDQALDNDKSRAAHVLVQLQSTMQPSGELFFILFLNVAANTRSIPMTG